MEVPNINCKGCEYQTEIWREHCAECLFNLEQLFKEKKAEETQEETQEDKLTDKDGDFCMGCGFKHTNPEKCNGCMGQK